jgi:hypothetical protein
MQSSLENGVYGAEEAGAETDPATAPLRHRPHGHPAPHGDTRVNGGGQVDTDDLAAVSGEAEKERAGRPPGQSGHGPSSPWAISTW